MECAPLLEVGRGADQRVTHRSRVGTKDALSRCMDREDTIQNDVARKRQEQQR